MIESNLYTQLDRMNLNISADYKTDITEFKNFIGKKYSKDYILALSRKFGCYYIQLELYNMFKQYKDHFKQCKDYKDIDFYHLKINRFNGNTPIGYIETLDKEMFNGTDKLELN